MSLLDFKAVIFSRQYATALAVSPLREAVFFSALALISPCHPTTLAAVRRS
jgi:hypothetical protein